jgi:hypothetical protein
MSLLPPEKDDELGAVHATRRRIAGNDFGHSELRVGRRVTLLSLKGVVPT